MASKSPQAIAKRAAYQREYRRKWREANPGYDHAAHYAKYARSKHLKRRYGITEMQYQMLYRACAGRCHICDQLAERLVVDHKHGTTDVRGLLCKHCNFLLGHAQDSRAILNRAIRYLEQREVGPHFISWDRAQNILKELDGK